MFNHTPAKKKIQLLGVRLIYRIKRCPYYSNTYLLTLQKATNVLAVLLKYFYQGNVLFNDALNTFDLQLYGSRGVLLFLALSVYLGCALFDYVQCIRSGIQIISVAFVFQTWNYFFPLRLLSLNWISIQIIKVV